MMKSVFFVAALSLGLSACALESYDKAAEPYVDESYDQALQRLCRLPLDIQIRAVRRGSVTIEGLSQMCPEWRLIKLYMLEYQGEVEPNGGLP